jgi:hypothetical protein
MGIETSPPDVEESTGPSLRSSSEEGHQELPGTTLDHSTATCRRLDEGKKGFITPDKVFLKDQTVIATLPGHHQEWERQYIHAHTFTIAELSVTLGVDLQ